MDKDFILRFNKNKMKVSGIFGYLPVFIAIIAPIFIGPMYSIFDISIYPLFVLELFIGFIFSSAFYYLISKKYIKTLVATFILEVLFLISFLWIVSRLVSSGPNLI